MGSSAGSRIAGDGRNVRRPQIAFQVLRPKPDGSLLVVETSRPIEGGLGQPERIGLIEPLREGPAGAAWRSASGH